MTAVASMNHEDFQKQKKAKQTNKQTIEIVNHNYFEHFARMSELSSPSRDKVFISAVKKTTTLEGGFFGVDNSNNALHVEGKTNKSHNLHLNVPKKKVC